MDRCFKCKADLEMHIENVPTCGKHMEDAVVKAYGAEDAARRGYGTASKVQVQQRISEVD